MHISIKPGGRRCQERYKASVSVAVSPRPRQAVFLDKDTDIPITSNLPKKSYVASRNTPTTSTVPHGIRRSLPEHTSVLGRDKQHFLPRARCPGPCRGRDPTFPPKRGISRRSIAAGVSAFHRQTSANAANRRLTFSSPKCKWSTNKRQRPSPQPRKSASCVSIRWRPRPMQITGRVPRATSSATCCASCNGLCGSL